MALRLASLTILCLIEALIGSLALADDGAAAKALVEANLASSESFGQASPSGGQRPRIGLVLSGGGARGAAHVGVIQVLEEMRVPIDLITGTSMGAIVGGLYASGMSAEELEATMATLDWADAFQDQIDREDRSFRRKRDDDLYLVQGAAGVKDGKITLPAGILTGQKIDLLLKSLTLPVSKVNDFDELSIPFRAVAADIVTGDAVVIGSGDLARAIRASMSIPAFFDPVEIDGRLLVDGGVANNLPIDVARQMGADVVIAIDISTPLQGRETLNSLFSITAQLTGILTRRNTDAQIQTLTDDDVLVVPELGDISSQDFDRAVEIIPIGLEATRRHARELQRFALPAAEYDQHLANRGEFDAGLPVIDFVHIENNSLLGDNVVMASLNVPTGQPLDVGALEKQIGHLYGWELFESIRYDVVEQDGETGLVVQVDQRPWGPNYLQLGIAASDNLDGDNFFNLAFAYTRTGMNPLGGELRVGAQIGEEPALTGELYQPLDARSRWFIHPQITYQKQNVNLFDDGSILSEFRLTDYGAILAGGRNLGNWGEVRVGLRRSTGDIEVRVGDPTQMDMDFDRGEYFIRISDDKIDNVRFPRQGHLVVVEGLASRDSLGADTEFEQVLLSSLLARPIGKGSILLGLDYNTTIDDDAPIQSLFRLGGLLRLSGFAENEIAGQHSGLVKAGYLRELGESGLLPFGLYAGGSLELGNVWQNTSDIELSNTIAAGSIFLGADTPLGPIYVAYGRAEGGIDSVYIFVGKLF